jgi:hypothetical protein
MLPAAGFGLSRYCAVNNLNFPLLNDMFVVFIDRFWIQNLKIGAGKDDYVNTGFITA